MALGHDGHGGAVRPPGGAVCDAAAAAHTEDYRQGKRQRGGADRLPGGSDCLHVAEVVVNTPARQRRGREKKWSSGDMKESSSASVTYLHVRVAKAKERGERRQAVQSRGVVDTQLSLISNGGQRHA
jgi:hypothetical protein